MARFITSPHMLISRYRISMLKMLRENVLFIHYSCWILMKVDIHQGWGNFRWSDSTIWLNFRNVTRLSHRLDFLCGYPLSWYMSIFNKNRIINLGKMGSINNSTSFYLRYNNAREVGRGFIEWSHHMKPMESLKKHHS